MTENKVVEMMRTMGEVLTAAIDNAEKFTDGNKSAGTRLRGDMQNVKGLAQEIRIEVQMQKNS
tara:strand:+ start:4685 stop:4873 length:189 start_codon:yes stop_codon:yes gene_type:complete